MSILVKITLKAVQKRIARGEAFDSVMQDYPRLTDEQKAEIQAELKLNTLVI